MVKRMKLSIIIPSYNNIEKTKICLKYLFMQSGINDWDCEVVVVDDHSKINVENELKRMTIPSSAFKTIKIIRNAENKGLAASRNIGAENSEGDVLLFLDNDIVLSPDVIVNHLKMHKNSDDAVCISRIFDIKKENYNQIIDNIKEKTWFDQQYMYDNLETQMDPLFSIRDDILNNRILNNNVIWPFGTFFCTSLRRDVFEKAGKFDENYKGWGPEDVDLSYRLYINGANFKYCGNSVCFHLDNGKKDKMKLIHDISMNSRYMFKKYQRNSAIRAYLNFYKGSISFEEFETLMNESVFEATHYEKLHFIGILHFIKVKCS